MAILIKEDLEQALVDGRIHFTGTIRKDSLLLTLGEQIQYFNEKPRIIDPFSFDSINELYGETISNWGYTNLKPNQLILISSAEFVKLDHHHHAFISTLSHVARLGLMSHASSSYVDPCFEGYLTLEIKNLTPHTFILRQGMPIAKLIIIENTCPNSTKTEQRATYKKYYGNADSLRSKFAHEFSLPTKGDNDEHL